MAGINMEMVLTDKVSPALRKMSAKIESLIKRLDSVNNSAKKSSRNLDKLANAANVASGRIRNTASTQNKLKNATDGVAKSVKGLTAFEQQLAAAFKKSKDDELKLTARTLGERLKASVKMQEDAVKREAWINRVMEQGGAKHAKIIQKDLQNRLDASNKMINDTRKRESFIQNTLEQGGRKHAKQVQKEMDATAKLLGKKLKASVTAIQAKNREAANFNNKTMSMRVAADRFVNSYINGIKRRQAASDKATQKEIANQNKIKKSYSDTNKVWAALKRGTSAYIGVQSMGGIINTSDSLTMAKARMNVVGDGVHSTEELMNMIYGASMRSRSGYLDMAASVSKVAMQAGSLFRTDGKQNNAAIVQFMENYNKMAAISGATQQQTSAAMLQIVQALSSGELRGDELRSVLENMPVVADYIAKKMGVARDQILSLGHEGKISAETLRDAVMGATDDLNEKMKKMPYTWAQVWTIFKNAALKAFEPVLNGISAILKNEKFLEFANAMGRALVVAGRLAVPVFNALGTAIGWIYDKVKGVYNFVKNNSDWIVPLVLGIAAALTVMYVAINLVTWATKIASVATKAWAAVQAAFNAVMAMNPVAWVIIAIIALIAAIYIVIAVINAVADTSISATGVIVGCAYWIWEVICNVGKWIANMFLGVCQWCVNAWEWLSTNFGTICDNIGTFWSNLWIDAKVGLYNFIAWAINKLASFAGKIKPLTDALGIDLSGLTKAGSAVKSYANQLGGSKKSYKSLTPMAQTNWETYAYGDLSDAYDKGYKVGSQFENDIKKKVKGLSEYFSGKEGEENDFYKALSGGFDNPATNSATGNPALDKISGDTGDIAKNTSNSEEDFSYLRELAEREAINKYTLTDLKIDMTNNNNISNGVDADNMMKRIAKELSRAVLTTAEGVTPW